MIRYLFIALLVCASCASRKIRNTEHSDRQQVALQQVHQSDSLQAVRHIGEHRLDVAGYVESAIIIPSGPFVYHPDSGYRGHAARVEVKRRGVRMERQSKRDSLRHTRQTDSSVTDSAATRQRHTRRHRDTRRMPWPWIVSAMVLAIVGWFLFRPLRR